MIRPVLEAKVAAFRHGARPGLTRAMLATAVDVYLTCRKVIGIHGMGLTQHVHRWEDFAMLVNLLMLRGNIGPIATGISPVRGHSNVQGHRTVGIAEKTKLVPLDKMETMFGFEALQRTARMRSMPARACSMLMIVMR